jgi:hypothetical protein
MLLEIFGTYRPRQAALHAKRLGNLSNVGFGEIFGNTTVLFKGTVHPITGHEGPEGE